MKPTILIVDDEPDIRNLIKGILEDEGYQTQEAENAKQAYEAIEDNAPALIILDIWLQGSHQDGLEILKTVKAPHPHLPVIMISGHGTIETAVSAIKDGAYDFIEKPFKSDRLLLMIQRALETAQLKRENEDLKKRTEISRELIGNSAAIKKVKDAIERLAQHDGRVLITGEAGTGKEVAARLIHRLSARTNQRFYALRCIDFVEADIAEVLGDIISNNPGTLFFDDISFLSRENQSHLIDTLSKIEDLNTFRILASTRYNLASIVQEDKFNNNLYQRLNVQTLNIPSLEGRRDDIKDLCQFFTNTVATSIGNKAPQFANAALEALQTYPWPGNVRQLQSLIEWLVLTHKDSAPIQISDLPSTLNNQPMGVAQDNDANLSELSLREAREEFERQYLSMQIKKFGGNISQTAKFVGMERSALHRKLKSLNILGDEQEKKRA